MASGGNVSYPGANGNPGGAATGTGVARKFKVDQLQAGDVDRRAIIVAWNKANGSTNPIIDSGYGWHLGILAATSINTNYVNISATGVVTFTAS